MRVPSKQYLGIAVGGAVVLLVANLLNTFYGWELSAMLIGLLIGLETGFLVGSYGESKAIYQRLGSTRLAILIGSVLYRRAIPKILTLTSFLLAIILALYSTQFLASYRVFTYLKYDSSNGSYSWLWIFLALLVALIHHGVIDSSQDQRTKGASIGKVYEAEGIRMLCAIVIGPLAPILMWVWISGLAILLVILGIFAPLKVLSISIRKNVTIPLGVVIGGLSGLIYGWTHLDFTMTSLAMITASLVGMFAAWLIVRAESVINACTEFVGLFVPGYDGPK